MYNGYEKYLEKVDIHSFKTDSAYCGILEHVSYELGMQYISLIDREYKHVSYDELYQYVTINDRIGNPEKKIFTFKEKPIMCSPSSLRYAYHALCILEHYRQTTCKNIVEVGCGYGGLCLAINYFSKPNDIDTYNIIDLPGACNLIRQYLNIHKEMIHTNMIYHASHTYGCNITDKNLFFISNYCYTELAEVHNANYSSTLLPKCDNGFLVWQNGGNHGAYPIEQASKISGKQLVYVEERPQTDSGVGIYKNYFVYF
jgi:hypothetical protein